MLYQQLRPTMLKRVVGQPEVVSMLKKMLKDEKLPHALLLVGPSGCGKTTVARILRKHLNCSDQDFFEVNCGDDRGIDAIRSIDERMRLAPFGGDARVWLLDESHRLTGAAQSILLKMLEDTPSHVYFMLATTDPHKLLATVKTRCTELKFKAISDDVLHGLLIESTQLATGEGDRRLSDGVYERIVEVAAGSARKALVILEQVLTQSSEEDQLNIISASDAREQAISICRALSAPKPQWSQVAKIVKAVDDEPEGVRRLVLAYFTSILANGGKNSARAAQIIQCFECNYFDSGKAGLVLSCYQACNQ